MNDRELLLAAVASNPDDDTPRLMLADYLDGQDARYVACPRCEGRGWLANPPYNAFRPDTCPRCDGENEILDPAYTRDKMHAELIKTQIELAQNPSRTCGYRPGGKSPPWCSDPACASCALYVRERKLLALLEPQFRASGVACPVCTAPEPYMRDACSRCHGTGDDGLLLERERANPGDGTVQEDWRYRVEIRRGMLDRVYVPTMAWCVRTGLKYRVAPQNWNPSDATDTVTVPSDELTRLLNAHPGVVEVLPLDREPSADTAHPIFSWDVDDMSSPHDVSDAVMRCMTNWGHKTRALALTALGRAVAAFGRGG